MPLERLKRHPLPRRRGPPPLGREPLLVFTEQPLGVDAVSRESAAAEVMDKKVV